MAEIHKIKKTIKYQIDGNREKWTFVLNEIIEENIKRKKIKLK